MRVDVFYFVELVQLTQEFLADKLFVFLGKVDHRCFHPVCPLADTYVHQNVLRELLPVRATPEKSVMMQVSQILPQVLQLVELHLL